MPQKSNECALICGLQVYCFIYIMNLLTGASLLALAKSIYYSVVEWLGYELWILRPGKGSQSCHIEFFFFSKFATEIFFLKNGTVVEETCTFMEIC